MQIHKFALALLLAACGGDFQHSGLVAPFCNEVRSRDASHFNLLSSIQCSLLRRHLAIVSSFLIPSRHLSQ